MKISEHTSPVTITNTLSPPTSPPTEKGVRWKETVEVRLIASRQEYKQAQLAPVLWHSRGEYATMIKDARQSLTLRHHVQRYYNQYITANLRRCIVLEHSLCGSAEWSLLALRISRFFYEMI